MVARLPNILTGARLLALVPFVILLGAADAGVSRAAAVIFCLASFTDFLDGYLARHAHAQTRFGRLVDPLADRLLINIALILLVVHDRIAWWLAAPILVRDLLLAVALRARPFHADLHVNMFGKSATAAIMAALAGLMLTTSDWPLGLYVIGLALSLTAAALYVSDPQGGLESKPS
jgi:cardiolipin synthase (CMP-forming)